MHTNLHTWLDVANVEDFQKIDNIATMESEAIQTQYDSSPRLKAFCKVFQDSLDPSREFDQILNTIADPNTAVGIFLDWWASRLGVSRILTVNNQTIRLDDEQLRFLIFYRAAANISDSSAKRINELLTQLLCVKVQVFDNLDMTIDVRILGVLSQAQEFILRHYGLLVRGAGVGYRIIIQNPLTATFGFHRSKLQPFNQGVYNPVVEINMETV